MAYGSGKANTAFQQFNDLTPGPVLSRLLKYLPPNIHPCTSSTVTSRAILQARSNQAMRGPDTFTESLFAMRRLEDFVPKNHRLRKVRKMVNFALKNIEPLLSSMYAADIKGGRPSIAPEKLLRVMLLQIFYSVRSELLLMEQTQYNLLYCWFIGLAMDDTVWVPTVFTKNRERLIAHDAVIEHFNEVLAIANKNDWLSGEHFSVDGTLVKAWAGHKSFAPKDGSDDDTGNFKGKKRSNDTHESTADADARL